MNNTIMDLSDLPEILDIPSQECAQDTFATEKHPAEQIALLQQKLMISERRYEILLGLTEVTTFEYNPVTKQIFTNQQDHRDYGMPLSMVHGVEDVIASGIIAPRSHQTIREFYQSIDEGASSASATITAIGLDGMEHALKLRTVSIFDSHGKPLLAVGIRQDITEQLILENEKQYGDTFTSDKQLTYEVDVTTDNILHANKEILAQNHMEHATALSDMVQYACTELIYPEHRAMVSQYLSKGAILKAYANNQRLISFEYLKALDGIDYQWYKQTLNIIQDQITGDIIIRSYVENINSRKLKELRVLAEQQHYEAMLSKSAIVYEMNITKDLVLSGHESWKTQFNIDPDESYTQMLLRLSKTAIHPEDRQKFMTCFAREHVLRQHAGGKLELTCEYRRAPKEQPMVWVRCTMHLFESPQSNDLCAFSYVENINEEKLKELDLIYRSQHDLLTGFYNKSSFQELLNDHLDSLNGHGKHVFFIVDLDHFKIVNDTFGHSFGDIVLTQTANRLKAIFRDEDILGRIGGDEFAIWMKDLPNYELAHQRAQALCDSIRDVYTQNGTDYMITVSIGMAYYSVHGNNYEELYNHSDTALYYAKKHGRNRYAVYHNAMKTNFGKVREMASSSLFPPKKFEDNISEFIFRSLYESSSKEDAINSVLKLVGSYYNVSRVYVFEDSADGEYTSNTFEWCNKGITPQMATLQKIPYRELGDYKSLFNEDGVYYLPDASAVVSPSIHNWLLAHGITSMLQMAIMKDLKIVGFIGFDQCGFLRLPSSNELWDYRNIANILGVFILEMRVMSENQAAKQMALSVVNGLTSYAYVCDPETHRVLFINSQTLDIAPNAKVGDYCYRAFWNRNTPCTVCPMSSLRQSGHEKYSIDMHNTNLNVWVRATASWIDWLDEKQVCLIDSMDITEYRYGGAAK